MYNLFLDDLYAPFEVSNREHILVENRAKYRKLDWVIVKTYEDFITCIVTNGIPDIVSFDHDLCEEHYGFIYNDENFLKNDDDIIIDYSTFKNKTGFHAAEFLKNFCFLRKKALPLCLVHSANSIGRENIKNLLNVN